MTTVSFSELWAYQDCERKYYYSYGLGLRPRELGDSIDKGVMGHLMLENFFKAISDGKTKEEAIHRDNLFKNFTQDQKSNPLVITVWAIVNKYLIDLDITDKTIFVEKVFVIPTIEAFGLKVGFTPDKVDEYTGGFLEVEDYKFVGRAWSKKKLSRYTQLDLYLTWLRHIGYNASIGRLRFFNTQTGEVTYKTYDPSPEKMERLKREFILNSLKVQEFKEKPVKEMESLATRTLNYNTCAYCAFTYVCNLELDGKDASRTLANEFTQNEYGYEQ